MTRPKPSPLVFVGALAAAGVGTLLWCAWLILTAPLPSAAAAASWTLWLLSVAALVTLVAYLREMVRHGNLARASSWKPLPGLVLLWVAGLTALVAVPFMLPERASGPTGEAAAAAPEQLPSDAPTTGVATGRDIPASVSRSTRSTTSSTTATRSTTSSAGRVSATTAPPAASTTSPRPSTTSSSTTAASIPILSITLPHGTGRPTTKPPHGH